MMRYCLGTSAYEAMEQLMPLAYGPGDTFLHHWDTYLVCVFPLLQVLICELLDIVIALTGSEVRSLVVTKTGRSLIALTICSATLGGRSFTPCVASFPWIAAMVVKESLSSTLMVADILFLVWTVEWR